MQVRVEAKVEAEVEAKVETKAPPQVGSRWPRQCKNFIKLDMEIDSFSKAGRYPNAGVGEGNECGSKGGSKGASELKNGSEDGSKGASKGGNEGGNEDPPEIGAEGRGSIKV